MLRMRTVESRSTTVPLMGLKVDSSSGMLLGHVVLFWFFVPCA
jgi:hypothetical protein